MKASAESPYVVSGVNAVGYKSTSSRGSRGVRFRRSATVSRKLRVWLDKMHPRSDLSSAGLSAQVLKQTESDTEHGDLPMGNSR